MLSNRVSRLEQRMDEVETDIRRLNNTDLTEDLRTKGGRLGSDKAPSMPRPVRKTLHYILDRTANNWQGIQLAAMFNGMLKAFALREFNIDLQIEDKELSPSEENYVGDIIFASVSKDIGEMGYNTLSYIQSLSKAAFRRTRMVVINLTDFPGTKITKFLQDKVPAIAKIDFNAPKVVNVDNEELSDQNFSVLELVLKKVARIFLG